MSSLVFFFSVQNLLALVSEGPLVGFETAVEFVQPWDAPACGVDYCKWALGESSTFESGAGCVLGETVYNITQPCPVVPDKWANFTNYPPFTRYPNSRCDLVAQAYPSALTIGDCAIACNGTCSAFTYAGAGRCRLYIGCCDTIYAGSDLVYKKDCVVTTSSPTTSPTLVPTMPPTSSPTPHPTTTVPTMSPTPPPTGTPTAAPSAAPTPPGYSCGLGTYVNSGSFFGETCDRSSPSVCYTTHVPGTLYFGSCPYGRLESHDKCDLSYTGECWVGVPPSSELSSLLTEDCARPQSEFTYTQGNLIATENTRMHYMVRQSDWDNVLLEGYGEISIQVKSSSSLLIGLDTISGQSNSPVFVPPVELFSYPDWSDRAYRTISEGENILAFNFTYEPPLFIPTVVAIHYEFLYPQC